MQSIFSHNQSIAQLVNYFSLERSPTFPWITWIIELIESLHRILELFSCSASGEKVTSIQQYFVEKNREKEVRFAFNAPSLILFSITTGRILRQSLLLWFIFNTNILLFKSLVFIIIIIIIIVLIPLVCLLVSALFSPASFITLRFSGTSHWDPLSSPSSFS